MTPIKFFKLPARNHFRPFLFKFKGKKNLKEHYTYLFFKSRLILIYLVFMFQVYPFEAEHGGSAM